MASLLPALLARREEFDLEIHISITGFDLLQAAADAQRWIRDELLADAGLYGELTIEEIALAMGQWLPHRMEHLAENTLKDFQRTVRSSASLQMLFVEKLKVAGSLRVDEGLPAEAGSLFAVDPDAGPERWQGKG